MISEKHLRAILEQDDTVLFIGSGVSTWSGIPTWPMFIRELADFIRNQGLDPKLVELETARNDLLQAASYGLDALTPSQQRDFIRQSCRSGIAKPHEIHNLLLRLGPRCFITTNYDKLIEMSLAKWRPDLPMRVVTNRQPIETGEIVQARSTNFLFKTHGDVDDIQSVILSREQYRALIPGGELNHAFEALRMLLASRPVVYIGYGLRDPDFLLNRDLLANTFKGGNRDHYAIMADVDPREIEYWRRNYGLHLLSYPTTLAATLAVTGSRDHSALLRILEHLAPNTAPRGPKQRRRTPTDLATFTLQLTRHAARLMQVEKPPLEFPLQVHARPDKTEMYFHRMGISVERFLDSGPARAVLIGHPGSGKTYALRQSCARHAERLYKQCMMEHVDLSCLTVPIFVDLKLYGGNVRDLISSALPTGLDFDALLKRSQPKFFLDAFNEMPREFLESGVWEEDFSFFLRGLGGCSVVIASRTAESLEKLELRIFDLDELDPEFVEVELSKRGINLGGTLGDEFTELAQKPFFFRLLLEKRVSISQNPHPRELYLGVLRNLRQDCEKRFGHIFDIERALALIAYTALDSGTEAFPVQIAREALDKQAECDGFQTSSSAEILNWLVSRSFLFSLSESRLAFFHQSVTEFLAAEQLAAEYINSGAVLDQKLTWHRWDEALFLTVSFLDEKKATQFIDDIRRYY